MLGKLEFICYRLTPIETFPNVTNTQIIIISQWPGRSAEEVEKFVTIPLETELNSVQKKINLRTTSSYELSYVRLIFDDVDDGFARQQIMSRIQNVDLPEDVKPEVEPPHGPTGEIYRYTLRSATRNIRDLNTLQAWVLNRQFKSIPGVADVNSFVGEEKSYEIRVDPNYLSKYGLSALDVYTAVSKSSVNVGGNVIERNGQAYLMRGIGLLNDISEIENIIITKVNGVPFWCATLPPLQKPESRAWGRLRSIQCKM